MIDIKKFWNILGPGILYAGAAVGVSHLVQSTRAGANFGMQLSWAVLIANLLKYPFFEAGPRYASISGQSLIEGYNRLGKPFLALFLLMSLSTMFINLSAICLVTAGIANYLCDHQFNVLTFSAMILSASFFLLFYGKYHLLDQAVKIIVVCLSLCTITASILLLSHSQAGQIEIKATNFSFFDKGHLFFLIAFMGWMPAPAEISVWHSIWSCESARDKRSKQDTKQSLLDFNIGYLTTAILAILFLFIGSELMYGKRNFPESAGEFAGALLQLYTDAIGLWSFPIVAIAAFATMFSTLITCLDAYPRVLIQGLKHFNLDVSSRYKAGLCLLLTTLGTFGVIALSSQNMKALVDFATMISFLAAPIIASLNYCCIQSYYNKNQLKLKWSYHLFCLLGLIYLYGFSCYFIFVVY